MKTRKNTYSYDELIQSGEGALFEDGSPPLPAPPMLMFDKITAIHENGGAYDKGHVRAALNLKKDSWFLKCHFLTDPVMPGCLQLDALWQMTGFFLGWLGSVGRGRALSSGEIKLKEQITPTTKLVEFGVDLKRVLRSKLVLGIADGFVFADGKLALEVKDLRVGLFNTDK